MKRKNNNLWWALGIGSISLIIFALLLFYVLYGHNGIISTSNDSSPSGVTSECTDSDGDNKYIAGYVSAGNNQIYDRCESSNTITEFFCDDTVGVQEHILSCDEGQQCATSPQGGAFCS